MVIFDVGHMRHGIDEAHGAIEIPEGEFAPQAAGAVIEAPGGVQPQQQLIGGGARQRRHAAVTRFAASVSQFGHVSPCTLTHPGAA